MRVRNRVGDSPPMRGDHPLEVEARQVGVGGHRLGPGRHGVEVGGQPVDEGGEVILRHGGESANL